LTGTFSTGTSGDIASTFPGFSLVAEGVDAKVILDALDAETNINIVSSPHLMVLDNQTASLQVGDEVPVVTRTQQSVITDTSNIVNNVEYKNTGVIMSVTPRVNNSGSIIMEVEQEVSNVVPSDEDTLTPTISQRKFKSSLVVQSGDTVVLGGLIFDFSTKQRSGLPLLSKIPVFGALFATSELDDERTELVMLITPRLVRNRYEAKRVTEEVRRRLNQLKQIQDKSIPTPIWDRLSPRRRPQEPIPATQGET
jgi:general secretion pathway protein D